MRESERVRGVKGGSDLVVGSNGTKVVDVEVVQLPNEEVNVA